MRVFKYKDNGDIKFIRDIYLGYKMDNVIFDVKTRILSVGIMGLGGYGGLAEIYPDKNFEVKIPFYDMQIISALLFHTLQIIPEVHESVYLPVV